MICDLVCYQSQGAFWGGVGGVFGVCASPWGSSGGKNCMVNINIQHPEQRDVYRQPNHVAAIQHASVVDRIYAELNLQRQDFVMFSEIPYAVSITFSE